MRIPRPIVKTYRLPQRLLGQQFCWSEMSSVSKINQVYGTNTTSIVRSCNLSRFSGA